jgi:curli biogenesis system outer membrane secretion channel CsgG
MTLRRAIIVALLLGCCAGAAYAAARATRGESAASPGYSRLTTQVLRLSIDPSVSQPPGLPSLASGR